MSAAYNLNSGVHNTLQPVSIGLPTKGLGFGNSHVRKATLEFIPVPGRK